MKVEIKDSDSEVFRCTVEELARRGFIGYQQASGEKHLLVQSPQVCGKHVLGFLSQALTWSSVDDSLLKVIEKQIKYCPGSFHTFHNGHNLRKWLAEKE